MSDRSRHEPERDDLVSRVYGASRTEFPPPAIDRRILRAARDAVARPKRRRWWAPGWSLGWQAPLATACVMALAVGLVTMIGRAPEQTRPEAARELDVLPARDGEAAVASGARAPAPPRAARARAGEDEISVSRYQDTSPVESVRTPVPEALRVLGPTSPPSEPAPVEAIPRETVAGPDGSDRGAGDTRFSPAPPPASAEPGPGVPDQNATLAAQPESAAEARRGRVERELGGARARSREGVRHVEMIPVDPNGSRERKRPQESEAALRPPEAPRADVAARQKRAVDESVAPPRPAPAAAPAEDAIGRLERDDAPAAGNAGALSPPGRAGDRAEPATGAAAGGNLVLPRSGAIERTERSQGIAAPGKAEPIDESSSSAATAPMPSPDPAAAVGHGGESRVVATPGAQHDAIVLRGGDLRAAPLTGPGQRIATLAPPSRSEALTSKDAIHRGPGTAYVVESTGQGDTVSRAWLVAGPGAERRLLVTGYRAIDVRFSPGGRWVAITHETATGATGLTVASVPDAATVDVLASLAASGLAPGLDAAVTHARAQAWVGPARLRYRISSPGGSGIGEREFDFVAPAREHLVLEP